MSAGSYNVNDQTLIGRPRIPPLLEAVFEIRLYGESFRFQTISVFINIQIRSKGEFFEPLTIVPSQMAYCDPDLLVFTKDKEKELAVRKQLKTAQTEKRRKCCYSSGFLCQQKKNLPLGLPVSLTPIPGFETKTVSHSGKCE